MKNLYLKIKNAFGKLGTDKLLHFIVGAMITEFLGLILAKFIAEAAVAYGIAFAVALGIAFLGEKIDGKIEGNIGDPYDFFATFLGACAGFGVMMLAVL